MLILLGFYKRKPGLTLDEFHRHWGEIHGPLVAKTPNIERFLKRYVQHHIRPSSGFSGVGTLDYDGFSEAWFVSEAARKEMHAQPYQTEVMIPDEHEFLDMSATRLLMFDKQVVQIGKDYAFEWMADRT
ncbi:EthD domain-containing protein [Seohaeicola nanhaiensis]|uniref:EthD domain-containing protein n=1 Tax=Seohaeicola nanhaiensis TaxID=1387282 RepID=A0ABV9KMJ8_9RHOB